MRLLLDGYWYYEGPPSGKMVLSEIVDAWCKVHPADELYVLVPEDHRKRVVEGSPVTIIGSRLPLHPAINRYEIPRQARRVRSDAVLTQNFAAYGPRSFVFVHDVLFMSNPEWFSRRERAYLRLSSRSLPRARAVLTSSRSERDRIRRFNPDVRDVRATGLGVPSYLTSGEARAPQGFGLHEFILCVGRLNSRKNLTNTLLGLLRSGIVTPSRPIVVVGEPSGLPEQADPSITAATEDKRVIFLGFTPNPELKWLYANTSLFVCMSRDEGFGLPPVEALTLRAPTIVSDIPVFHETLGSAAFYSDPNDVDDIARACSVHYNDRSKVDTFQPPSWSNVVTRLRAAMMESE